MKTQFTSRIVKLTFAFMFVLIASSCSQDDEAMDAAALAKEINSELSARPDKVSVLAAANAMVFSEPACVGVSHSFTINNTQTGASNGIQVHYETSPGVWVQLYQEAQAANATTNFSFTFTAAGTYNLRYKMDGSNGFVTGGSITVSNCNSCTIEGEEFTGAAVSCVTSREANFTFGSEDGVSYFKMQGGLTNFTGSNATVYINGDEVTFDSQVTQGSQVWETGTVNGYTVGQRTQGGSSNRNIRVEGGLGECSDVVVRIVWTSSNSGGVITGGWSVVDAAGVEYAPEVAGLECL
ncbi:MAG: hypothetical protein Q8Q51_01915 [Lutibacter sp.]|nr:hypothetical protein [Lutibacter sp.]